MSVKSDDGWTSIPVRPNVRDRIDRLKQDGESWGDMLERLADEATSGEEKA